MNTHIVNTGMGRTLSVIMTALLVTVLAACDADDPASAARNGKRALMSLGGTEGRTYLNVDGSEVAGYLKVSVTNANDSRWGSPGQKTSLMAIGGGASGGPLAILGARANGVVLEQKGQSTNIRVNDAPSQQIVAGNDVHWDVSLDQNVHFNGSIALPVMPRITNLVQYSEHSKSSRLVINWESGGDPRAEATIMLSVDPVLTREEGGDVTQIGRNSGNSLFYTTTGSDNGQIAISPNEMADLPENVYVRVSVATFNYQTLLRSDGARFGLLATSQFNVPIKLIP